MVSKSKHTTSVKGEIVVVIGPNGYGKTTYLDNLKKSLEKKGENVLFIPSEIKLLDEMKDTVDTSQAMEFLLQEILETPEYVAKRESLFAEADKIISDSLSLMNGILDEVLDINDSVRTVDFIAPNPKKRTVKNIVNVVTIYQTTQRRRPDASAPGQRRKGGGCR